MRKAMEDLRAQCKQRVLSLIAEVRTILIAIVEYTNNWLPVLLYS